MTIETDFATKDAFTAALKSWRLKGKAWIFYSGRVCGAHVELKTYGHTYLQIFRINGANQHLSPMDCKVKDFDAAIAKGLASIVENEART